MSTIGTTDVHMLKPQNVSPCVLAHLQLQPYKSLGIGGIVHIASTQSLGINLMLYLILCRKEAAFSPLH